METKFNSDERKRIQQGIKEKYKLVAINPEGKFRYPTGRAGLEDRSTILKFSGRSPKMC
jgi:hypothetical protein